MKTKILIFFAIGFFSFYALAKYDRYGLDKFWKISLMAKNAIERGDIIVEAEVDDHKSGREQSFKLRGMALHKRGCRKPINILSQYEMYDEWVDFIHSSTYDKKHRLWTIRANHTLLPYPMLVHIIIDRVDKPGVYDFMFPTGIFTGLKGKATIKQVKGRCLYYVESNWRGKHTKIPNFVIDIFAETLSRIGGSKLLRMVK
jgi:hypothetical protein